MIGIMADSHDNLNAVRQAVRLFNSHGCRLVFHAGDFVAPFSARELHRLSCPLLTVYGNCDGEKEGLREAVRPVGKIFSAPHKLRYEGRRFLLTHIPLKEKTDTLKEKTDVYIFGHTHRPEIRREGKLLIINPGEVGGWVTGKNTVAIYDLDKDKAEILPLS